MLRLEGAGLALRGLVGWGGCLGMGIPSCAGGFGRFFQRTGLERRHKRKTAAGMPLHQHLNWERPTLVHDPGAFSCYGLMRGERAKGAKVP